MRISTRSLALLAVLALLLIAPAGASALTQTDVDTSYGGTGTVTPALPTVYSGFTVAPQPDGKLVGGYTATGNVPMAYRLNADGSLDSSFGTGGKVNLAVLGATSINVDRVLIAGDGTIYLVGDGSVAGFVRDAVWALTPTGAPKLSFNITGAILLPIVGASQNDIGDAALTPGGEIVIAARTTPVADKSFSLRVVTATGTVTTNVTKTFAGYETTANSVAVLPDGRIVVAATLESPSTSLAGLVMFSSAGVWDATFGGVGLAIFGPPISMFSVPFRTFNLNGRIGVVGMVGYTSSVGIFTTAGFPIPEIGANSVKRLLPPGASFAYTVDGAAVGSGKIAAVGAAVAAAPTYPYVVRYNADGTPDSSFAPGGVAFLPFAEGSLPQLALQPDGKYVIAARNTDSTLSFVRIWGDSPAPQPVATVAARASFASSVKKKSKASKTKTFSGKATGTGLTRVELAIQKVDSKLLKKSKKCSFVKSTKSALKSYKAVKGKCVPGAWLKAKGTSSWSLKLSKALAPGKYVLSVRATGAAGVGSVATKSITLTK